MATLLADFNSVRDHNRLVASLAYADGPILVCHGFDGPRVLVTDGEGQSCWALPVRLRGALVELRLDLSTWRSCTFWPVEERKN